MRHFAVILALLAPLLVSASDDEAVTCGSVIKLMNTQESARLHSHDVKYGSGSGQQSVTGVRDSDDVNSHWQILPPIKGEDCVRGEPVKCGQRIRLLHLTTGCHLHSHHFDAPLSRGNQEVSCFGKEGAGDSGDHWQVQCEGDEWVESEPVRFRHEDTGAFLGTSGQQFGRPIAGQREVVCVRQATHATHWKAAEGVYMVRNKEEV